MLDARVCGIPCQVDVTRVKYQKPWRGSRYTCETPEDYYGGFTELEYDLYDRRGYRAKWLENKMTSKDHTDLLEYIAENMEFE